MEEEYDFDFNEILKEFREGKRLTGKGGLLAPLIKNSQKLHWKQKQSPILQMMYFEATGTEETVAIKRLSKVPVMELLNLKRQETEIVHSSHNL